MKKLRILITVFLAIFSINAESQLITPFSIIKTVTQQGDITFAANTITSCTSGTACTTGRAEIPSAGTTNNQTAGITIGYVDIDGSTGIGAATFSSSNANLTLGSTGGCGVIYAYLVWGGFVTTGTTNYAKRDSVYMQLPGATSYLKLKADEMQNSTSPYNATYHCYKDVTNYVKAAGAGTYTIGNVVAAIGGTNQFAGWTLVIIYSDPNLPLRNLSIFKGLAGVATGANSAVQFPISGFFTPPSPAAVNVKVGAIVYDGDRALNGDSLKFNGVPVSNTKNLQNDVFNSSITLNNNEITRSPSYTNTLGYDTDIFSLANSSYTYLGNSASSAQIRLSTSSETYLVNVITTAIDVFEPEIRFEKTFVNLSGNNPAQLGDIIEYTLKVYNRGSDPADSLVVIDSLYGALNYVPNSMQILTGPNTGSYTDNIGDDPMDFFAAGNFIKVRLGTGANGTRGGKLRNIAPDSVTSFRFRASITTDCTIFHCLDSVYNMAYATYYGQTAIAKRSTFSSANGIDPGTGCALSGPTGLKVTVPSCPLPADTSFSNCTPYNLVALTTFRPGYTSFLNNSFTPVTQANATGTYYAIKSIYPSNYYLVPCNDTIQINFTSTGTCLSLPLQLLSFTAKDANAQIILNWTTVAQNTAHYFELERSIDGRNFETIGRVEGKIISAGTVAYNYTDSNFPLLSKLYYRIKQTDINGKTYTSNIKTVVPGLSGTKEMFISKIFPNPATEFTIAKILATSDQMIEIRLLNVLGRNVYTQRKYINTGNNELTIPVNNLEKGFYWLEISNPVTGTKSTQKILVQ